MITNTYTYENKIAFVSVSGNKYPETFQIDSDFTLEARKHRWTINKDRYVQCTKCQALLHRLVMRPEPNEIIDHINHNTLNNRRYNLRIVTHKQNMQNRKPDENSLIPVKGVYLNGQKWSVYIQNKNNKRINIGYFDDLNEAVIARIRAEYELYGEYSLNYRDVLKHIPANLKLLYLPEIFGRRNHEYIGTNIYKAHMVGDTDPSKRPKLRRYRKSTREEFRVGRINERRLNSM